MESRFEIVADYKHNRIIKVHKYIPTSLILCLHLIFVIHTKVLLNNSGEVKGVSSSEIPELMVVERVNRVFNIC